MSAPETFLGGRVELYAGDCLDVLRTLPDASMDSIVSDPPYALVSITRRFGKDGAAPAKVPEGGSGAYARASGGFMGQKWDTGERAFSVEFWAECFRVLKPGGHVVAFAASRTSHRLTCAIEDAGFEIRDTIYDFIASDTHAAAFLASLSEAQLIAFARVVEESGFGGLLGWCFGTGFPKSHDVAKGIQRRRVEDVEPIRVVCRAVRAAMDGLGLKSHDLVGLFGDCHPRLIDHWGARDTDSQPSLPTWDQWLVLRSRLSLGEGLDAEVWRLNGRKGMPGDAWSGAEVIGEHQGSVPGLGGGRFSVADTTIRVPSIDAAVWEGWGTALKPAMEPITLARKPLAGTVAENVLAHGTGALNIDGCRIGTDGGTRGCDAGPSNGILGNGLNGSFGRPVPGLGRWPANVIHDGSAEAVAAFPETTTNPGTLQASAARGMYSPERAAGTRLSVGDTGSAARFFYSAKADGESRIGSAHPTVKPVDLMRWLVRLVTPPGGVCLDPFAGTGTTGEAAFREGMRAVLVEREPAYRVDIARRMALAEAGPATRRAESAKARARKAPPLALFGEEGA